VPTVLIENPEGKRQVGWPRHTREDNTEDDHSDIEWWTWNTVIEWINQNRFLSNPFPICVLTLSYIDSVNLNATALRNGQLNNKIHTVKTAADGFRL
jgi:hypothetical protein